MKHVAGPTAALAGVPAGIQAQGVWTGRRQLFIRFAAEAETATMYTADALAQELRRCLARSSFHSVSFGGRDALANSEFITVALERFAPAPLPVMLDSDGQRPDELAPLIPHIAMLQVTLDGTPVDASVDRALESLRHASHKKVDHALVLAPDARTSDAQLLRLVEQAHEASESAQVVIHPPAGVTVDRDRRWVALLERAHGVHSNLRLLLRLPPPTGMR
jgi:hypothetical protein